MKGEGAAATLSPLPNPSPATTARPARLIQRRDDDDPEVTGRASAWGKSWIPPLGPERPDGPLEPPLFVEEPDNAEDVATPEDDEPMRGSDPLTGGADNATLTAALAAVERDDSGDQVDEIYAIGRGFSRSFDDAFERHSPVMK